QPAGGAADSGVVVRGEQHGGDGGLHHRLLGRDVNVLSPPAGRPPPQGQQRAAGPLPARAEARPGDGEPRGRARAVARRGAPAAIAVSSDAAQRALGPSDPKAVTVTCTSRGLSAASSSRSKSPLVSSSTSASRISSKSSARLRYTPLDLPRLKAHHSDPSPR